MIDPEQMKPVEQEADNFLDRLKRSGFTALILGGAALVILGLIVAAFA